MKTVEDISYGVVPLFYENGAWYVFCIHQYGSAGDVFWTFPKGHPEADETPEESARRELSEETGIVLASLDTDTRYLQEYTFLYEDVNIHKQVIYFKGIAKSKKYVLQTEEVADAGWFTINEAIEKLTHEQAREMLNAVSKDVGTE